MSDFPDINDAFGNWLAGFIDGEGCFTAVFAEMVDLKRAREY